MLFDVNLQAHDSIFGEILVSFGTSWSLGAGHVLEKRIQRRAFDSFPSENTVSSWQHGCEAKE